MAHDQKFKKDLKPFLKVIFFGMASSRNQKSFIFLPKEVFSEEKKCNLRGIVFSFSATQAQALLLCL